MTEYQTIILIALYVLNFVFNYSLGIGTFITNSFGKLTPTGSTVDQIASRGLFAVLALLGPVATFIFVAANILANVTTDQRWYQHFRFGF